MAPFLKKIPVLTLGALSACLIVAACGYGAEQRGGTGPLAAAPTAVVLAGEG